MTDREKLVELLRVRYRESAPCDTIEYRLPKELAEKIADHLLANGVTFATDNHVGGKWIPVTERLPEQYESVIVWTMWSEMGEAEHDGKRFRWVYDDDVAAVTHWMPFPEPPKEGE